MPRILLTGAAGGIGTSLRALLPPIYPDLLLNWMSKSASETKAEFVFVGGVWTSLTSKRLARRPQKTA